MQRTRYARHLILGLTACGFLATIVQGGCAQSDDIDIEAVHQPDGGSNTGGSQATGGSQGTGASKGTGTGGNTQSGGSSGGGGSNGSGGFTATGGTPGTGGATGGTVGTGGGSPTGGTFGTGGTRGSGGVIGTGGMMGLGGSRATGGTVGTGGSGGAAAVTFTQVYQSILTVSCKGSSCHSPGTQGGVSFASQSSAYSAVKSRVVAGNANSSSFYTLLTSGRMPQGAAKLSTTLLNQIAAWINAGAMNN